MSTVRALISSVVRSIAARLGCRALVLRAGLLAERDLAEMNARATRVGGVTPGFVHHSPWTLGVPGVDRSHISKRVLAKFWQ